MRDALDAPRRAHTLGRYGLLLLVLAACATQAPAARQDTPAMPIPPALESPRLRQSAAEEVVFRIRLADGKTRFRLGEVVRVELEFSSRRAQTYALSKATYDRSGRLGVDEYHVSPREGVSDPLRDYFERGRGYIGGGLSSSEWLSEKPARMVWELNEWHRFDRPGRYRLSVTTHRVGRRRGASADVYDVESVPLESNAVEFEMLPRDARRDEEQLRAAVTTLDAAAAPEAVRARERRREACRVLRFLGTRGAARELARRVGADEECAFDFLAGMYGSPERAAAVAELERLLVAPEHAVTPAFFHALVGVSFAHANPPSALHADGDDESNSEALGKSADERARAADELAASYRSRLAYAVGGKRGRAQAVTLATLLRLAGERARPSPEESAAVAAAVRTLPRFFHTLPEELQKSLLKDEWERLDAQAMLPALRSLPRDTARHVDLRELALRRVYETAPEEGRRLVLEEIKNPETWLTADALSLMPEATLPELDDVLASVLERSPGSATHARLVARYATPNAFTRLRAVYGERGGRLPCAAQAALLAYFLRVEPGEGAALLSQALAARGASDTRCWTSVVADVAALHDGPELERAAVETLSDPSAEAAAEAAQVLAAHGSPAAEDALWRRLERWHEEWRPRAGELRGVRARRPVSPADEATLEAQAHLEYFLMSALVHGRAWVADPEKLKRLRDLCLTDAARGQVQNWLDNWDTAVNVFFDQHGRTSQLFSVAHYQFRTFDALKDKLARFPAGTTFFWRPDERPEARRLHAELRSYLEGKGMKLQASAPADSPPLRTK